MVASAIDFHRNTEGKLSVFNFNVGQGDHILVRLPNKDYGIIDFHYDPDIGINYPPALIYFNELKTYLKENFIHEVKISFFCFSHYDFDHIKGISTVFNWLINEGIEVKNVWLPGSRSVTDFFAFFTEKFNVDTSSLSKNVIRKLGVKKYAYEKELKILNSDFIKWRDVHNLEQDMISLNGIRSILSDKSNQLKVVSLGPLENHINLFNNNLTSEFFFFILGIESEVPIIDQNHFSSIFKIIFGDKKLLFGGDSPNRIIQECIDYYNRTDKPYIEEYGELYFNFIKGIHHGSRNSSSPEIWETFISKVDQPVVIFSFGENNNHNHPHSETIEHIFGAKDSSVVLFTQLCQECNSKFTFRIEHHNWVSNSHSIYDINSNDSKEKDVRIQIHKSKYSSRINSNLGYIITYSFDHNGIRDDIKLACNESKRFSYCHFKSNSCPMILFT